MIELPEKPTLKTLRAAATGCRACPLWERGTQTVFGEGAAAARVVLVGEQPGNEEDRSGRPFVGPAGRILDDALEEAGIDRKAAYVSNVVKHFKWEPRGKRRIHSKPNAGEVSACLPWLRAELDVIKPMFLVCLGATAAQALLGRSFRVTVDRGKLVDSPLALHVLATVHPSSILREPDDKARKQEMRRFVEDLSIVGRMLARTAVRKRSG